jgi:mannose-1-phosphate guanylyltransferase
MIDHYYAVIMAGGGGTRLWPLSRRARPKQLLSIFEERSLFQTAVNRLEGVFPYERILVVTVESLAEMLSSQVPEIPRNNYLIEPLPRGTASVVGLAALEIRRRDPEGIMAILTSDHFIGNEYRFRLLLEAAFDVATDGYLATLGIRPTFPATGYGYIQQGDLIGRYQKLDVFQAMSFKEKPNEELAEEMIAGGNFAWNSGMFVWKIERVLAEIERQMPELFASLMKIDRSFGSSDSAATVREVWPELEVQTIDYGVMEGAERVALIPAAGLGWSDVGSWDSLFDVLPGDQHGNIVMGGEYIGLDTRSSLIYVNQPHRLIVTIGIEDLVVVDTGDVLLVCRKDQAQKVRQVVSHLEESGQNYI